jgi:hypothetical protein
MNKVYKNLYFDGNSGFRACSTQTDFVLYSDGGGSKSVNCYQTTRRNIPEDSHLRTRRREDLKSHLQSLFIAILNRVDNSDQCVGTVCLFKDALTCSG